MFSRFLRYNGRLKSSLLGLLYKIAENIVVDYYRRRKVRADTLTYSDNLDIHPDLDSDFFASMKNDDLCMALKNLTGEQYQVVILRFIEGYSIREAGEITRKSDNAVKALQFRALKSMKHFFTEDTPCEG